MSVMVPLPQLVHEYTWDPYLAQSASDIQYWYHTAGVLTSDPRLVKGARPVPVLTYDEATELAFFGATVLHPQAMQPAFQQQFHDGHKLAVRVKNSYNRYIQHSTTSLKSSSLLETQQRHFHVKCSHNSYVMPLQVLSVLSDTIPFCSIPCSVGYNAE